jgi:DUF4097 and DUF4098 domain-containing protein YvlB
MGADISQVRPALSEQSESRGNFRPAISVYCHVEGTAMKLRRVSAVVCAFLLVAGVAAAADETERVQRTVPLAPGGTLKLHNFSGHVNITGTDRPEVVIDATRRAPRERLDRIKLDVQASGSTVTIEANKKISSSWFHSDVVETEMEIQVPRQVNLDIDVFSSDVMVTDVDGRHDVHTFSGTARLIDVNGPIKGQTFSGNIDLELKTADTRPDLNLHTFSGDITIRLPASAHADVDFDSFSGDLRSDVPLVLKSKSKRSLKGELGTGVDTGRSSIYLKTFSGDVHIRS